MAEAAGGSSARSFEGAPPRRPTRRRRNAEPSFSGRSSLGQTLCEIGPYLLRTNSATANHPRTARNAPRVYVSHKERAMPGSSVKAGLPQSGADMTRESMFETFKHQGSDDLRNAWESQLDADISVAARNSAPVLITAPSQAADAIVRAITTRQQDP